MNPASGFDPLSIEKELPKSMPVGLWNLLCLCSLTHANKRPDFSEILSCLEAVQEQLRIKQEPPRSHKKEGEEEDEGNDEGDRGHRKRGKKTKKTKRTKGHRDKKKQQDLDERDGPATTEDRTTKRKGPKEKRNNSEPIPPHSPKEEFEFPIAPLATSLNQLPLPKIVDKPRQTDLDDEGEPTLAPHLVTSAPQLTQQKSGKKKGKPKALKPISSGGEVQEETKRSRSLELPNSEKQPSSKKSSKGKKPKDKSKQDDLQESPDARNFKSLPSIPVHLAEDDNMLSTSWPRSKNSKLSTPSQDVRVASVPNRSSSESADLDARLLEEDKSIAAEVLRTRKSIK